LKFHYRTHKLHGASAGTPSTSSSSSSGHYSAVLAGLSAESSAPSLPITNLLIYRFGAGTRRLKKWRPTLGTASSASSTGDSDPGRELSEATR